MTLVHFSVWYNIFMKNRDYKRFSKDGIYHVFNRGVGKMKIFLDDQDCAVFLSRLRENLFPKEINRKELSRLERRRKALPPNSFSLVSYCLMPNHFHLVIQQATDLPITILMSKVCTSYSMYFNKKYKRVGGLFQDQFKAVLVENNPQLLWVSFYVHKNPLEAHIVKEIEEYKWSSYPEYSSRGEQSLCKRELLLEQFDSPESFVRHFKESLISEETNYKMIDMQELLIDD